MSQEVVVQVVKGSTKPTGCGKGADTYVERDCVWSPCCGRRLGWRRWLFAILERVAVERLGLVSIFIEPFELTSTVLMQATL